MPLLVRPFDHAPGSADWQGQRALFDRIYGPDVGARRERALRWVTLDNPVDLPDERRYVVDDGGKIVASLGRMPVRFAVAGEPILVRYSHDLLVDPAYRGQKLAQRLVRAIAERSDSPVGGLWMNDPSYAIHLRCGWRGMKPSHAQIRILDATPLLSRRLPAPLARLGNTLFQAGLAVLSPGAWGSTGDDYAVEEAEKLGAEADALWAAAGPALGVAAVRDAAYLRWRFEEAPHARYTLLAARRGGALAGYVVLRLPPPGGGATAVLVDLLARPDCAGALTALAREALLRARAAGAAALVAFTTFPAFRRRLARLGFVKAPRPQTFVLSNLQGAPHQAALADPARWYLTFTDSDGDMWTGAQPPERI